jgi:hypothetical protein
VSNKAKGANKGKKTGKPSNSKKIKKGGPP